MTSDGTQDRLVEAMKAARMATLPGDAVVLRSLPAAGLGSALSARPAVK
jgi:hypothetical protein